MHKSLLIAFLLLFALTSAYGQDPCPAWPLPGSVVTDAPVLNSQNGVLTVNLTMHTMVDAGNVTHYCYSYSDSVEAPTLLANPGDVIIFNLTNDLTELPGSMQHGDSGSSAPSDPCAGGSMTSASTNVHFHGLNIPPKCHQDEVIKTTIQPGDPPFEYKFQIPKNDPPGLYWYHPHIHMFTATQVVGGAAGALIIGGLEQMRPEISGLAERVFTLRQFNVPPPRNGARAPDSDDTGLQLSINFVPAYVNVLPPIIQIKPGEKQLWRVLNATSTQFFALQLQVNGIAQNMLLVALDGVPLLKPRTLSTVNIPPAGRAEFVVQGPPQNSVSRFVDLGFDTGPDGDPNPARLLAAVDSSPDAPAAPHHLPTVSRQKALTRFANLENVKPFTQRKLYFSEKTLSNGVTEFFITVDGQKRRLYDPNEPPAIITRQGAVEDWTIENRSKEVHAFHIHQIHFLVLDVNGKPADHVVRDTIHVPYWTGSGPFPSVTLRMDFRDPETVGTFLYHCHILDHEDGGMMAKIKVLPAK